MLPNTADKTYFSESVLWICHSHVLRLPSVFPSITRISTLFIGDVDELLASLDCGDRLLLLHTEHAHIHETSVQSQTIWNQRSCFGIHVYFHTSFLHQEHVVCMYTLVIVSSQVELFALSWAYLCWVTLSIPLSSLHGVHTFWAQLN